MAVAVLPLSAFEGRDGRLNVLSGERELLAPLQELIEGGGEFFLCSLGEEKEAGEDEEDSGAVGIYHLGPFDHEKWYFSHK